MSLSKHEHAGNILRRDDETERKFRHGMCLLDEHTFPWCSFPHLFMTTTGKNLLDGRYAEFGYTTNNAELLADVKEGDIIKSAKIISGKENWKASV